MTSLQQLRSLSLFLLLSTGCGVNDFSHVDGPLPEDGELVDESAELSSCTLETSPLYALGGTVLTPLGPVDGYVLIKDELIVTVVPRAGPLPTGAVVVETAGVISPGLVDLHNHVSYNFLPKWNPGKLFTDRYQWSRIDDYADQIRAPYNQVRAGGHLCEAQKYGELKSLVGGTTTIQGSIGYSCQKGWVRNVESYNFCEDRVRQWVLSIKSMKADEALSLRTQMDSGKTRAFLVHLAEGTNDSSRSELDTLDALNLMRPEVVLIHGTALDAAQLGKVGAVGMKMIWSPSSNLALYGETTDIATALASKVQVALAPDWTPSGSANLLGELKVADKWNRAHGGSITDRELVEMATLAPAGIVALGDKLGRIAPGYHADLLVVRANDKLPYRAVIEAAPNDVLLTTVGGRALFGVPGLLNSLGRFGTYETVDACGEVRGLAVKDPKIFKGYQTLSDLTSAFAADGVTQIAPLFECPPELSSHP